MRTRRSIQRATVGVGLAVLVVLAGCNKTPLATDGVRSQYDRYDQTRNDFAQPYVTDEFGMRRPNLRARLLEKN